MKLLQGNVGFSEISECESTCCAQRTVGASININYHTSEENLPLQEQL